ncbi:MAG TPA: RNA methyltransferase [Polyangiaceae bacterium]|jgi:23S rRNA (guanosine2251-2'-O)-methyltransferase|nr:RNA methyltransferase [Polyangiaceae bacterium]
MTDATRPYRPQTRGGLKTRRDVVSPHPDAPRLVIGMQPVREAIRAHGKRLAAVLVEVGRGESTARLDALARFATDQGIAEVRRVERRELDSVAQGGLHQGALAWAPALKLLGVEELLAPPDLLVLALDGIQDPQNFGAAIRSAVGLGATSVVWPEHAAAPLTPATFRASAGAIEHARLGRVPSLVRFVDDAVASGAAVVGLTTDAERPLQDLDLGGRLVLVIGSEHEGIGRAVRKRCTALGRLTLKGPVESLNASAAAAVALAIAGIQRTKS